MSARYVQFILLLAIGAGLTTACDESAGPSGPEPPRLLSPATGARFRQNDPTIGCAAHPTRGYGHRLTFDWEDVPGASNYLLLFGRRYSEFPLVDRSVESSEYEEASCNAFVVDGNLNDWIWTVGAVVPMADGQPETLWSEIRASGFMPCRLTDGSPCSADF